MKSLRLLFIFSVFGIGAARAQYTDLINFTDNPCSNPGQEASGNLTLSGGLFYSMTEVGVATDNGVIFFL